MLRQSGHLIRTIYMKNAKLLSTVKLPLFLTIFADTIGLGLIFPIFTAIILQNSIGIMAPDISSAAKFWIYALLLSSYPLAMFFGAPILGEASDKYGRRSTLIFSLIGNCLGLLITAAGVTLKSIPVMLIGRLISGITAGSFPIAQAAIIDISEKDNTASSMSIIVGANAIGFALGPMIGGVFSDKTLSSYMSASLPFIITAVVPAMTACLLYLTFKETKKQSTHEINLSLMTGLKNIFYAFNDRTTSLIFTTFLLYLVGYFIFFNYLSAYLSIALKFDNSKNAEFISYFAIWFGVSLLWIVPWISRKIALHTAIKISMITQVCVITLILLVKPALFIWLTIGVLVIAFSTCYISSLTYISSFGGSEHQGRLMGIAASLTSFSWALAPFVAGTVDWFNIKLPMLISIVTLCVGYIVSLKLKCR